MFHPAWYADLEQGVCSKISRSAQLMHTIMCLMPMKVDGCILTTSYNDQRSARQIKGARDISRLRFRRSNTSSHLHGCGFGRRCDQLRRNGHGTEDNIPTSKALLQTRSYRFIQCCHPSPSLSTAFFAFKRVPCRPKRPSIYLGGRPHSEMFGRV